MGVEKVYMLLRSSRGENSIYAVGPKLNGQAHIISKKLRESGIMSVDEAAGTLSEVAAAAAEASAPRPRRAQARGAGVHAHPLQPRRRRFDRRRSKAQRPGAHHHREVARERRHQRGRWTEGR